MNSMILVTGSSRGIGHATAEHMLGEGYTVVGVSRSVAPQDLMGNKSYIHLQRDLSLLDSIDSIKLEIMRLSNKYKFCGLVLNAGAINVGPAVRFDEVSSSEMMKLNYSAQIKLMCAVLPRMIVAGGGSVVAVSSNAVSHSFAGRSAYAASKAALSSYVMAASRELGSRNVRMNVVEPGLTETELMRDSSSESEINAVIEHSSLKKVLHPEAVANVISFLLSEKSSAVTGQVLRVDGGY